MSFANKNCSDRCIVWNWAIACNLPRSAGREFSLRCSQSSCFRRNGCCLRETGRKGDRSSNGCDSTRTMSAVVRAGDHSLWANDVLVNNAVSMLTPLVRLQTSPFLSRSCRSTTSVLSIVPTMPALSQSQSRTSGGYLFTLW